MGTSHKKEESKTGKSRHYDLLKNVHDNLIEFRELEENK
jgi:hypothetical protein